MKLREALQALVNDDAWAITFQTMGQYRAALLKAIDSTPSAEPVADEPVAWREHVEQRLLTWRSRSFNQDGDRLSLDDFMDKEIVEDLIDFVCDAYTRPA